MIFSASQWFALIEETNTDNVDWPAVILALMFDQDPRIESCEDALLGIIDYMDRDTVYAHVTEMYRNIYG